MLVCILYLDCLDIDSKMFVRYSELKDGLLQTYQMLVKSHQAIVDQESNQSSEVYNSCHTSGTILKYYYYYLNVDDLSINVVICFVVS